MKIKKINKLANKSYVLQITHKEITNKLSEILNQIHPDLEEELRKDGCCFIDDMMDYAQAHYKIGEIKKQINKALQKIKLK